MARSGQLTVRLIREDEEWDALRPAWDRLYAASQYAAPPLDFMWLRWWWRIYGPVYGSGGLHVITAWRGAELVGALPLYRSGRFAGVRRLRFVSTGEAEFEETCPDYMNLLCLDGDEDACIEAVRGCLDWIDWDHLELLDLPEGSSLLRAAVPGFARAFSRGGCPVADLAGGFEAYLGRLSSNSRQQARRLLREGERAGATFAIVAPDQADEAFDDLVRLHQSRWAADGMLGAFSAPRFVAFHREITRVWLADGRAVLARLFLEDEPVAVLYGFVTGPRFHFYQSGVRRGGTERLRSPGILAHLLLMRALADTGVTEYDFLRGTTSYKQRLATRQNRLAGLRAWRSTLRAATCRSIDCAARVSRRGRRVARRAAR